MNIFRQYSEFELPILVLDAKVADFARQVLSDNAVDETFKGITLFLVYNEEQRKAVLYS